MFHTLCGGNQRRVPNVVFEIFVDDFLALGNQSLHALALLAFCLFTHPIQHLFQTPHMLFCLLPVVLKSRPQLLRSGGLRHFRKSLHQLILRIVNVAKFFNVKLLQRTLLHWEPSFKIVNVPANLKEAPGTGYPAKGVVLQKCMLYFQIVWKKCVNRQTDQFFQVSEQIGRVVALQNQVIRGLVATHARVMLHTEALLMKLKEYRKKRHFDVSPEPQGQAEPSKEKSARLIYVVRKYRDT